MNLEQQYTKLKDYLVKHRLKSTRQRDVIVRAFLESGHEHFRIEDLHAQVKRLDPKIGYATVYRTLVLLRDAGLALQRHFGDGHARFEQASDIHHDHLICTECGKIVEFINDQIEGLQEQVARQYDFHMIRHKMELYGVCADCRHSRRQ